MAYQKQDWQNLPNETTPISAERLTHIEDGIYNSLQSENITTDITSTDATKVPTASTVKNYADKLATYSTEETVIGTYNGKLLYRKIVNATVGTIVATLNALNIDELVNYTGWATSNYNFKWSIPSYYKESGYINNFYRSTTDGSFKLSFGDYYPTGNEVKMTLEYTKTTD